MTASRWHFPVPFLWLAADVCQFEEGAFPPARETTNRCGDDAAYEAVSRSGRIGCLCVAHAAHVRACPDCLRSVARIRTARKPDMPVFP